MIGKEAGASRIKRTGQNILQAEGKRFINRQGQRRAVMGMDCVRSRLIRHVKCSGYKGCSPSKI